MPLAIAMPSHMPEASEAPAPAALQPLPLRVASSRQQQMHCTPARRCSTNLDAAHVWPCHSHSRRPFNHEPKRKKEKKRKK